MSKIDLDKFVEHLVLTGGLDFNCVQSALWAQGLILDANGVQKVGEDQPSENQLLSAEKRDLEDARRLMKRFPYASIRNICQQLDAIVANMEKTNNKQ